MKQVALWLMVSLCTSAWAADGKRPLITGVSHIAIYAANPAAAARFYAHDLGGMKSEDVENGEGVRYYFSPAQYVEVLPLPPVPPVGRLDHMAFETADAERLRAYVLQAEVKAGSMRRGSDGSRWFNVVDPEGNRIQFVQGPVRRPAVPANPLSSRIIHVGFVVHDRAREDAFFRGVLGFRPYWQGGFQESVPNWISQQVPDGSDWLEYMIATAPNGKEVPDTKPGDLGIMNHFSLGVLNMEAAFTRLWNEDRMEGQKALPQIGRDAKWQLNLLDPDGTRAEIMEFHAIGKPCCSPFTASDPD